MTRKRATVALAVLAVAGTWLVSQTLGEDGRPGRRPAHRRQMSDPDELREQLERGEEQMARLHRQIEELERQQNQRRERLEGLERRRIERREEAERREIERREERERIERQRRERGDRIAPPRCPRESMRPGCRGNCPHRGPGMMREFIEHLREMCSDPATAGLIAIGALKDDIPREPGQIIEDLEDRLSETRSLPLRNAIRLSLKDLCKQTGQNERALNHLREMLAENDKAVRSARVQPQRRRPARPGAVKSEKDRPPRRRRRNAPAEKR